VISAQEEIGPRGAHTEADVVKPDIGIAIQGGITGDVYPGRPKETQAKLGAGPGFFLYDTSTIPNRKMVDFVKQIAAERKLPLQADLVQGYSDDSAEILKSNGGVPTVNLVVPTRYTHAFNGILNRRDFDQMVERVVATIKKLDATR
jgi:putative aminopeptidase FrvX